jgi:GntR family transcriptional regulator
MISAAGYKPGVELFERELVKADKDVSKHLGVPEGLDILVCRRVRTADEMPVIYSIDYFPSEIASLILSVVNENISLYSYIEENRDIKIGNSLAEIMPVICDLDLAKKLNYQEGKPIFKIKQVIYDQKQTKLIYGIEYFRPDYFKLSINRRRIQI